MFVINNQSSEQKPFFLPLIEALIKKDQAAVSFILPEVNETLLHRLANNPYTPLNAEVTQRVLDYMSVTVINQTNKENKTPIHIALDTNNNSIISNLLLTKDSSTWFENANNKNKQTPLLHQAIAKKNVEGVFLLLVAGADITQKNNDGKTAVDMINNLDIKNRKDMLIKNLIEQASQKKTIIFPIEHFNLNELTPATIIESIKTKRISASASYSIVKKTWKSDTSEEIYYGFEEDSEGEPLIFHLLTAFPNNEKIMEEALKYEFDKKAQDKGNRSLMDAAAVEASPQVLKLLLEKKLPLDANKRSPFNYAARERTEEELLKIGKLLIDAGVQPDQDTLFITIFNKPLSYNKLLIEKTNIPLTATNKDGDTPLHILNDAHIELLEPLIKKGFDINARNNKGETPLSHAAEKINAHLKIAHKLIDLGADITLPTITKNFLGKKLKNKRH